MLPKASRLSRAEAEFLKNGKSVFTTLLSLRFTPAPETKFSVSVSKKTAKSAVDRNRIRRKCYAALEKALPTLNTSVKGMFFPKATIKTLSQEKLAAELVLVLKKAGIIS
jgi:ribonuclease P protein component